MGISGEVDIDFVFRHHPGHSAAGSATLDAEDWPQRWLPEIDRYFVSQTAHTLGQANRCGGLALTGWCWGDPGDHHQLASVVSWVFQGVQRNLGLITTVGNQVVTV